MKTIKIHLLCLLTSIALGTTSSTYTAEADNTPKTFTYTTSEGQMIVTHKAASIVVKSYKFAIAKGIHSTAQLVTFQKFIDLLVECISRETQTVCCPLCGNSYRNLSFNDAKELKSYLKSKCLQRFILATSEGFNNLVSYEEKNGQAIIEHFFNGKSLDIDSPYFFGIRPVNGDLVPTNSYFE